MFFQIQCSCSFRCCNNTQSTVFVSENTLRTLVLAVGCFIFENFGDRFLRIYFSPMRLEVSLIISSKALLK